MAWVNLRVWKSWVVLLSLTVYLVLFFIRQNPVQPADSREDRNSPGHGERQGFLGHKRDLDLESEEVVSIRKTLTKRVLLSPSIKRNSVVYVSRNHTLIAVHPEKEDFDVAEVRDILAPESKNSKVTLSTKTNKSINSPNTRMVSNEASMKYVVTKKNPLYSQKKFVQSHARKDLVSFESSPSVVFHTVSDPNCHKKRRQHPSCKLNNYPECHAEIITCQPHLCLSLEEDKTWPFLVVIIPSHPSNHYRREAIRDTWGSHVRNNTKVIFVFLLGETKIPHEQQQIARENALYKDIVQYSMKDHYDLLSVKSILMLDWIYNYCKGAKYFLKTDDDAYLSISHLVRLLENESSSGVLIGSMHANSKVQRNGQWKVGREIYPHQTYPPYCSGTAYVMSADVVRELYLGHYSLRRLRRQGNASASGSRLLPMEDVYVTGVLPEHVGRTCRDSKVFPNWTTGPSPRTVEAFLQGKVLGLHGLSPAGMYGLQKLTINCGQCAHNRMLLQHWFPLLTGVP